MMDIRFLAEKTLGRLVTWLRILGFDTVCDTDKPEIAGNAETRIRLTRTQQVAKTLRNERMIFIISNDPVEQLRQVIEHLDIAEQDIQPFSRCLRCNTRTEEIEKDAVKGSVPDYIFEIHDRFRACRRCEKIYWPGSHTARSLDKIRKLFVEL
jgi:uncharacterized protein